MATNPLNNFTLTEVANRTDPSGDTAKIVEVLMERNDFIKDTIWFPSNDITQNKTVRRAALPSIYDREYYKGVPKSSSKTDVLWDKIGTIEGQFEIDYLVAEQAAEGKTTYINQEVIAFTQKFGQTMSERLIYSNGSINADRPTGLQPRLETLSDVVVDNGDNTAYLSSIYIVTWGRDSVHCLYPKNSRAGLEKHMWPLSPELKDSDGNNFMGYKGNFLWRYGLVVRDPEAVGRVANIDTNAGSFSEDKLMEALTFMKTGPSTRIYVSKKIWLMMWKRLGEDSNKSRFVINSPASPNEHGLDRGGMVDRFNGIPVRIDEQILNTESRVT